MGIGSNIKENRNSKTKENIKDNIFRDGSGSNIKDNSVRVIKGSLFAIITSTIFLIVFAVLLTYTNLSETSITPVVLAVVGISILTGSYFSTRKIQQNGILNGAIVGIVYMLILYIISSMIFMDFSLKLSSLIMIGCGMIAGIIGGIIGVNVNK
jgi:putative membrane protein (TIGR04086 family)